MLDNLYATVDTLNMKNTTAAAETSQQRLNRLMREAQRRTPVGTTINNKRGTARWNGSAWVYGQNR